MVYSDAKSEYCDRQTWTGRGIGIGKEPLQPVMVATNSTNYVGLNSANSPDSAPKTMCQNMFAIPVVQNTATQSYREAKIPCMVVISFCWVSMIDRANVIVG